MRTPESVLQTSLQTVKYPFARTKLENAIKHLEAERRNQSTGSLVCIDGFDLYKPSDLDKLSWTGFDKVVRLENLNHRFFGQLSPANQRTFIEDVLGINPQA